MEKWSALSGGRHPLCRDEEVVQDADQVTETVQISRELIVIKDSFDVEVKTTDTQAAVNLQVALQLAIALVLSITIADSDQAEKVRQDLFQRIESKQINNQRTVIEHSRGVRVVTTDTDVSVNIQALLQILVSLVAKIDIL
ncbi:spore coat protein [Tumebacillus sp. DT12]|uniref:Spore coat protein n=1 Tax=Tumebacillus lacus TaxID=2995335 RepID=A0ABT3WZE8_9BACL|nr:spore coat protein [Tumebacillus lacus]MCX7570030.1 spore coat protein [Tumebacillus lacus]